MTDAFHYEKTKVVYQRQAFAELYANKWINNVPNGQIDAFLSRLDEGAHVVDIGCGPGHHTEYIATKGFSVLGIDQSQAAIGIAKKLFPNQDFLCADALSHDFSKPDTNGVWACASLVHFPPDILVDFLARLRRSANKNLILSMTISTRKKPHFSPDGRYFFSFRDHNDVRRTLARAGLRVLEIFDINLAETTDGNRNVGLWTQVISTSSSDAFISSPSD